MMKMLNIKHVITWIFAGYTRMNVVYITTLCVIDLVTIQPLDIMPFPKYNCFYQQRRNMYLLPFRIHV